MDKERKDWLGRLSGRLFKEELAPPSLRVEENGFAYVRGQEVTRVAWPDVKEVFAFRHDVYSVDLICVGFRVSDDGAFWEIDETMAGYEDVEAALGKAFPGLRQDWRREVAMPAFETNLVTLWGQPKIAAIWQAE